MVANKSDVYAGGYSYQKLRKLSLSDESARLLAGRCKVASYSAGQMIWGKGSEVTSWSCVVGGLVAASIQTDNTRSAPIMIYGDHSWFGEFSILNKKPAYADFICLLQTDILLVPADHVMYMMDREPGFATTIAKMISWRAQKSAEMLMVMKHGNPCLRVVMGICQFAETLAYNADRPPTIGYGEGVTIPVIQETLASMCGVSRSKASEFLHHLSLNGWLRIAYGEVEILALQTWHRFATLQRDKGFCELNPSMQDILNDFDKCNHF